MAGRLLADKGHAVDLHARSEARASDARASLPHADAVLVGDVSTIAGMHDVACQAEAHGRFDPVIHNVGFGYREPRRVEMPDGLSQLWAVNVLAPYFLTSLMRRPRRLLYLTSGMHLGGDTTLDDVQWSNRRWNGSQAYSDTKRHDVLLAFAIARRWPDTVSNAVSPGWVATKMGGPGAPDDLAKAYLTQAWLAAGEDDDALVIGHMLYHHLPASVAPAAHDEALQERLLAYCQSLVDVAPT